MNITMRVKTTVKHIIISLLAHVWVILFANRRFKKRIINNILLVFPYGIGNVVLANGALKSIKKSYPNSELTAVYMQKPTKEILNILGGFKDLIFFDVNSNQREKNKFVRVLRDRKIDIAINFFAQSNYVFNSMLLFAKVPIRIGFQLPKAFGGIGSVLFLSHYIKYDCNISEFENDLNLLEYLDIPLEKSVSFRLKRYNIVRMNDNKVKIGIHIGRPNLEKPGWPVEKFYALILLLKKSYDTEIFVLGGQEEAEVSAYLDSKFGDEIVNLIGKINLQETIDYIHSLNVFISNDTGLMHIAASQNVPLIALFGPTDSKKSRPISDKDKAVSIISLNLPCSPCYPLKVGFSCNKDCACMNAIDIDMVFEKAKNVLLELKVKPS